MADATSAESGAVELGRVAIVGGGCYGSFYAGQLRRARERGRARIARVLVVDRDPACRWARDAGAPGGAGADPGTELVVSDWDRFFDRFLAADPAPGPPDAIVPSPLMPHLMYRWLVRRARARWPGRAIESVPLPEGPGTPYDLAGPDGTRYVSFADWICPVHCVEPLNCPVIRAPRTWEMGDALAALVARLDRVRPTAGPVLFECRHRVFGVGMFDAAAVRAGDDLVARRGAAGPVDVLVATVSSCHGAAGLLRLGPP